MNTLCEYTVGDMFRVHDRKMCDTRNVVLARFLNNGVHYCLVSVHSFEPWTERVISRENAFEHPSLSIDEVKYLAEDGEPKYAGNIFGLRNELDSLIAKHSA